MKITAERQIHIEQLKVLAHVGVSPAERKKRQRLVLNITVWPARDHRDMKDAISCTVDYAALCQSTKTFISEQDPQVRSQRRSLRFRHCHAHDVARLTFASTLIDRPRTVLVEGEIELLACYSPVVRSNPHCYENPTPNSYPCVYPCRRCLRAGFNNAQLCPAGPV